MNIAVITKHADLVEQLRTAFEAAGHQVRHVPDPLQALALEVWREAHLLLVDADGDSLDGLRFSALLRGEARHPFRSLPIFLIYDTPVLETAPEDPLEADIDGRFSAHDGLERILGILAPALEGGLAPRTAPQVPVLATGFSRAQCVRIGNLVDHFGFRLTACPPRRLAIRQEALQAPVILLGLDSTGERTLRLLETLRDHPSRPYIILAGRLPGEGLQRKLTLSGIMDWIPVPLSDPLLLHALRRGMEWQHLRRMHREFQSRIPGIQERRQRLELEATSLRSEVLTDPLTGLLNRRAFNQNLEAAIGQWARQHRPFVLILGDIDYFKLINDRFGHLIGDQVLKLLAERIRTSLRRSDLAFRIGGEEFAVILTETDLKAGTEVADKLRRRIDENPIHLETGQSIFPTISFGVGTPADLDAEALFKAVDEALYIAKHKGRNRIEVVPERHSPAWACTPRLSG